VEFVITVQENPNVHRYKQAQISALKINATCNYSFDSELLQLNKTNTFNFLNDEGL
jgi:hypothetical protein